MRNALAALVLNYQSIDPWVRVYASAYIQGIDSRAYEVLHDVSVGSSFVAEFARSLLADDSQRKSAHLVSEAEVEAALRDRGDRFDSIVAMCMRWRAFAFHAEMARLDDRKYVINLCCWRSHRVWLQIERTGIDAITVFKGFVLDDISGVAAQAARLVLWYFPEVALGTLDRLASRGFEPAIVTLAEIVT